MKYRAVLIYLFATSVLLAACERNVVQRSIGIYGNAPDENAVSLREKLRMPTSRELPLPQPGAKPLVAVDHKKKAEQLVGVGEIKAVQENNAISELLASVGAESVSADIRRLVDKELEENRPKRKYGLTSIFGFKIEEPAPEEWLLDAKTESERLHALGVKVPTPNINKPTVPVPANESEHGNEGV